MKIMTYNVLNGFENAPERKQNLAQYIQKQNPDILFLNELNEFDATSLAQFAEIFHHPYTALLSGRSDYRVAITSKTPITEIEPRFQDLLGHGYIYAKSAGVTLLTTHLSPHSIKKRNADIEKILLRLEPEKENQKIIFGGDLNAFLTTEKAFYDDPQNHTHAWFIHRQKRRPELETLTQGQLDFSVTNQILQQGYIDLLSSKNTHFQKSYPSSLEKDLDYNDLLAHDIDTNKILMRIDYLWANPLMASHCTQCYIPKDPELETLSDHFPIIAEFD